MCSYGSSIKLFCPNGLPLSSLIYVEGSNTLSIAFRKATHCETVSAPLYKPLVQLQQPAQQNHSTNQHEKDAASASSSREPVEGEPPQLEIDGQRLQPQWTKVKKIGAGLHNLGNTCYLNSALQCLTYTPLLYNYLISKHHSTKSCNNLFVSVRICVCVCVCVCVLCVLCALCHYVVVQVFGAT